MADRPIIFSAPMVRALLAGEKTQTRRLISCAIGTDFHRETDGRHYFGFDEVREDGQCGVNLPCLPYAAGDRLYVRERHWLHNGVVSYWCDEDGDVNPIPGFGARLLPSIHMPRTASRLTLLVEEVRVQRVQSISVEDATAEGVCETDFWERAEHKVLGGAPWSIERLAFADLWNSLHGKDSTDWEANPWIVAVSFTVQRGNIDRPSPTDPNTMGMEI